MSEIIKNIILGIFAFSFLMWLVSSGSGWLELAAKYRTEDIPDVFYLEENQRISFKHENKTGGTALTKLGLGVSDYGLYLSNSSIPFLFGALFPALFIPWTDIAYDKSRNSNSSADSFTFYLGKPRVCKFSINANAINTLERDYGQEIFLNKLGQPDQGT